METKLLYAAYKYARGLIAALLFLSTFLNAYTKDSTHIASHRMVINGAYTYLLVQPAINMSPDLQRYIESMTMGNSLSASYSHLLTSEFSVGLRVDYFQRSTRQDFLYDNSVESNFRQGKVEDKLSLVYAGPEFLHRYALPNPSVWFVSGISLGVLYASNTYYFFTNSGFVESINPALHLNAGFDFFPVNDLALGIEFSYLNSYHNGLTLQKTIRQWNDLNQMSRMSISMGLRLYF